MGEGTNSYKSYTEQLGLQLSRGKDEEKTETAVEMPRRVNYYRLSDY